MRRNYGGGDSNNYYYDSANTFDVNILFYGYYIIFYKFILLKETPTHEELWREYLTNRSRGVRFLIINNNITATTAAVVELSRRDSRKRFVSRRRGLRGFCIIIIIIATVFRSIKFFTSRFGLYNITFLYACHEYRDKSVII